MTQKTINLALIQCRYGTQREDNLAALCERIRAAAANHADLVILSELHNSLYFCQTEDVRFFDLAENIPGPTSTELSALAKDLGIVIVASLFERRTSGLYHNTAIVLEKDGTLAGRYRKMHIPDDPGYYEKFYFTPGDLGFKPISTSLGKIGLLVCWDQWYPEAARLMTLAGADLLVYPTAIGWDKLDDREEQNRQREAWITVQRGHAIANGIPVVVCNRVGYEANPQITDAGIDFWGTSFVCGAQGEIIAKADVEESTLTCSLDIARSEQVRQIWPFLRDRRIEDYSEITRRFID